jgi:hypothetical protein
MFGYWSFLMIVLSVPAYDLPAPNPAINPVVGLTLLMKSF